MAFMHNRSIGSLNRQYRGVDTVAPQNNRQHSVNSVSTEHPQSVNRASTQCPQSVNAVGCCIMYNPRTLLQHRPNLNVLAAILRK